MKAFIIIALLATSLSIVGCEHETPIKNKPVIKTGFETYTDTQICDMLTKIKVMPFKYKSMGDKISKEILRRDENILPCLVSKIPSTRKPDGIVNNVVSASIVVEGDLAFFLILDKTGLELKEFLPAKYKKKYEDESGVYAYYEYVDKKANRLELKEKIEKAIEDVKVIHPDWSLPESQ